MKRFLCAFLLLFASAAVAQNELSPTNYTDPTADTCEFLVHDNVAALDLAFIGANLCVDASDAKVFFSGHGDCDGAGQVLQFDLTTHVYTCLTLADADIPDTVTIGLAATATALAADPADCAANQFADAIAASGALTCNAVVDADVPNTITIDLAATATALAANGANCAAGEIALGVDTAGAVEGCYQPAEADITDLDHLTEVEARTGLIENGSAEMTGETIGTACAENQILKANATGGLDCAADAGGAETNDLESVATSAGDAEVFIGTGADAGAYITGLAACAADEKIEYVPGSPDTFTCEAIGSLVEADVIDLSHVLATAAISDVSVTQTEFAELETIGTTTISANQWAVLGGVAETLTFTELDLLDGITTLSGSNTGDQNLADTVAEITDLDDDAATLSLPASTTISAFGATVVDDANAAAARTTLGVDAAGTDNSTDVTLSGTPDYITISGQVITRGTVDIGDDTNFAAGTGATLTGDSVSADQWGSIALESPADADSFLMFRAPFAITLTDIFCIVDPADSAESVVIDVQECNSTGDSCVTVDATITCDNDGAEDDGALSNGAIDSGDWVLLDIGTVTGTVTTLTVTWND